MSNSRFFLREVEPENALSWGDWGLEDELIWWFFFYPKILLLGYQVFYLFSFLAINFADDEDITKIKCNSLDAENNICLRNINFTCEIFLGCFTYCWYSLIILLYCGFPTIASCIESFPFLILTPFSCLLSSFLSLQTIYLSSSLSANACLALWCSAEV